MADETVQHSKDSDCTVENDECTVCHVTHGDPCVVCGGRGFHVEGCERMDQDDEPEEDRYPLCPECLQSLDSLRQVAQCPNCGTEFGGPFAEILDLISQDIFTDADEYVDRVARLKALLVIKNDND